MEELLTDLGDNARRIAEHGKRADRIVQGMLLHSRGTAGERATDINAVLDESANLAYHGLRAKILPLTSPSNATMTLPLD